LILSSCAEKENEKDIVCTWDLRAGIVVNVFDEVSLEPISCDANLVIREDFAYEEVIERKTEEPTYCDTTWGFAGAYERQGTYELIISKPGYQSVLLSNVEVKAGTCHVNTVTKEIYLEYDL